MTTNTAPHRPRGRRNDQTAKVAEKALRRAAALRRKRRNVLLWGMILGAVTALIGGMMWTARSTSTSATRTAPNFSLTDTAGHTVRLADYRGRTVVLYFSEGAGCQSCLMQMADVEKHASQFSAAGVTVLPIVMNTADQIKADMATNGVKTPFLLDDGTV